MRREGFVVKLFLAIVPAFQCTYLYRKHRFDSLCGTLLRGPNFPVVQARLVLRELSAEFDFQGLVLRIPPQRSFGKPYIWVDVSPYLKKNGSSFFPAIAMLVEPGNIYVNEQKLQHGPRFATMAIAAQAGFWRLRDWGLWDVFFQWWMLMEEIRILVETLEILHGTFSMSTGPLHRYESPTFWLGHASDLNFI